MMLFGTSIRLMGNDSRRRPSHRRHFGGNFTEGARRLWLALEKRGWDREELTRQMGLSRGVTTRWLYGDQKPDRECAGELQELLGIPLSAWNEEPSARFVLPAMRKSTPSSPPPRAA